LHIDDIVSGTPVKLQQSFALLLFARSKITLFYNKQKCITVLINNSLKTAPIYKYWERYVKNIMILMGSVAPNFEGTRPLHHPWFTTMLY